MLDLKIHIGRLAIFLVCLVLVIILHYFQGGFNWTQILIALIGSLSAFLEIADFLKRILSRKKHPSLQSTEPIIRVTVWDQETKKTVEIRGSGSKALDYVDGMSRLLLHQSTPATEQVAKIVELMQGGSAMKQIPR